MATRVMSSKGGLPAACFCTAVKMRSTSARGEAFGQSGVHTALAGEPLRGPRALGERIVKAVKVHAAGRDQADDITLMCVGRVA